MTRFATSNLAHRCIWSIPLLIATALLTARLLAQTNEAQGAAKITSVSPISPKAWQTIVIKGRNLGVNPPINGCPDHLRVTDVTTNWSVPGTGPFGGCQAGIFVSSWNDTEIVIEGFPSFQHGQDAFKVGDVIKIEVSNAQQGGPTSWYSERVSTDAPASASTPPASAQNPPPVPGTAQIASVSPISPKAWQTIAIKGSGFGRNPPVNGCPDHLRVTDVTTNWSVPGAGPFGGCQAGVFVTSWNDTEIVIEGFPSFQRGQDAFKVGDVIKIEVSNAQQGGPTSWYSVRVALPGMRVPTPGQSAAGVSVVSAVVREQATSLELPPGKMYLYGMETGGGFPSSTFAEGQYAQVENVAGKLSAALAYGTNKTNSYNTQTVGHSIGGVSIAGSWEHFAAFNGSNHQRGAHDASVSFQLDEQSLVVVFALASTQPLITVEGIPGLQVDATGGAELIGHAYLKPGMYTAVEHSNPKEAGHDPSHMADLIGVFVFSGKQESEVSTVASEQPRAAKVTGGSGGSIRSVDFQNFSYTTNCLSENDPAQAVHVSNGQASNQDGQFFADKPVYGDFTGDGQEHASVVLSCHPGEMSPNVVFSEVFIFEMSGGGPRVLAKLPPSAWNDGRVTGLKVSGRQLAVEFSEMGDKGFGACPEWIVTSKLRWNGNGFVKADESRRKNSCAQ